MTGSASIDHIGIAGPDLLELEKSFQQIGFTVAPRCELVRIDDKGEASPLGQVNCHVIFDRSYIELTAVEGDLTGHHLEQALSRYFGLHIIVLTTEDAVQTRDQLKKGGVDVTELGMAGRTVRYPGARGDARFRWFAVPEIDEAFACFVEHLTPELVFKPDLPQHPNGARELSGVIVCCNRPAEAAGAMAKVAGAKMESANSEEARITMPLGAIRYLTPGSLKRQYPGVVPPALPWLAGLQVAVADLAATARYLSQAGITHDDGRSGIWIDPARCGGALVEFTKATR